MPPYPTRSYVRAHPSFQLNDGNETESPTKRSPNKQSSSRQSPHKQSPTKRSQKNVAPSKRPKVKVTTIIREGSVHPTPRTTDPTTPQTYNPPTSEDLSRAPKKLKRASKVIGGDDGSWLATQKGGQEDVSPLTSFAPGRLSILPEIREAEDDSSVIQREYVKMIESREVARKVFGRQEKENLTVAGPNVEASSMDVDQDVSSTVYAENGVAARVITRTDTEEVFN